MSAHPVLAVQTLARRIAEIYSLDVGTIVVTFLRDMKPAGRVELGGAADRDFFVEVRSEFQTQPKILAAILGHEIGHIFLHHHRLHPPPSQFAEILTDTVAVLYGFGPAMADTFVVTEKTEVHAGRLRTSRVEHHMGYLTPEEMGFALVRAGFGAIENSLESDAARSAFLLGRQRASLELSTPPLRRAGLWERLLYRALRWWTDLTRTRNELTSTGLYALEPGRVQFRCILCCQAVRVPTGKRLTATCPRCRTAMPCAT